MFLKSALCTEPQDSKQMVARLHLFAAASEIHESRGQNTPKKYNLAPDVIRKGAQ